MNQRSHGKAPAYLTERLATKEFDYPYTFRGRNECKELSILNVGTLRREIKLQTIFHKLFAQGHTSCHLKCPYEMYS